MKRSTFSALSVSALSALVSVIAIAPAAQALPKVDSTFNLQSLRIYELDARNKAEEDSQPGYSQPGYSQPSTQYQTEPSSQYPYSDVTPEPGNTPITEADESATWENSETWEEEASPELSLTQRRHQSLDRS